MINPAQLVSNLVTLLREIQDLVTQMGNDKTRIYAYHDLYPTYSSLMAAIHDMPSPGIMVAWQGTEPSSFGGVDVWRHRVSIYLRARQTSSLSTPAAYYTLFRLITKGTPSSQGVPMLNVTVHSSCYPMDLPRIQRQTDAEGLDYFEIEMSFMEMGDE